MERKKFKGRVVVTTCAVKKRRFGGHVLLATGKEGDESPQERGSKRSLGFEKFEKRPQKIVERKVGGEFQWGKQKTRWKKNIGVS